MLKTNQGEGWTWLKKKIEIAIMKLGQYKWWKKTLFLIHVILLYISLYSYLPLLVDNISFYKNEQMFLSILFLNQENLSSTVTNGATFM